MLLGGIIFVFIIMVSVYCLSQFVIKNLRQVKEKINNIETINQKRLEKFTKKNE